jgi:hypothetical protein
VFREIPSTRAISAIGICSARRSRRISAQSSTLSTCSLPGSAKARVSGKLVKIRLPRCDQYSVAADTAQNWNVGAWEPSCDAEHQAVNIRRSARIA